MILVALLLAVVAACGAVVYELQRRTLAQAANLEMQKRNESLNSSHAGSPRNWVAKKFRQGMTRKSKSPAR
jgi:hypothetical protein